MNRQNSDLPFYTSMGLCAVILTVGWFSVGRRYDLHGITRDEAFWIGGLTAFSFLVITVTVGMLVVTIAERRHPEPLPIDPDFPPTKMIYLQGEGEPERCDCHGRVIEDGAEILHWPQPAKLVCVQKGDGE
jgi:hypothetical protein